MVVLLAVTLEVLEEELPRLGVRADGRRVTCRVRLRDLHDGGAREVRVRERRVVCNAGLGRGEQRKLARGQRWHRIEADVGALPVHDDVHLARHDKLDGRCAGVWVWPGVDLDARAHRVIRLLGVDGALDQELEVRGDGSLGHLQPHATLNHTASHMSPASPASAGPGQATAPHCLNTGFMHWRRSRCVATGEQGGFWCEGGGGARG